MARAPAAAGPDTAGAGNLGAGGDPAPAADGLLLALALAMAAATAFACRLAPVEPGPFAALALPALALAAAVAALELRAGRAWAAAPAVLGSVAAATAGAARFGGLDWGSVAPVPADAGPGGAAALSAWTACCVLLGIVLALQPVRREVLHALCWLAGALAVAAAVAAIVAGLGLPYLYSPALFGDAGLEIPLLTLTLALSLWRVALRLASPGRGRAAVEDRIVRAAAGVLGLALLVTASVAFAEMRRQIEHDKGDLLAAELVHQVNLLETEITSARRAAMAIAGKSAAAAGVLHRSEDGSPAQAQARAALRQVAAGLVEDSFSAFVFLDAAGREAAVVGHALAVPQVLVNLPIRGTQLLWAGGYVLRTSIAVELGNEVVGHMIAEQPLRDGQRMLGAVNGLGATGEIELCSRQGEQVLCFPSRFNAQGQARTLGTPARIPSDRAVTGERETVWETDYRGKRVLAALHPAPELNLGLVAKRDADEVLAPVRRLVEWGLPLLAALVAAAFWLLDRRLKPMARAVVDAQRDAERHAARWAALNEAALDGFLMLRPLRDGGRAVADWRIAELNPAAERLLRLRREAALAQPLGALLGPASANELARRCAEVEASGEPATFESEVESKGAPAQWLHYNVIAFRGGVALTIKDLTQRKKAELELADARERLQLIADNMPALVAYVDERQVYRFANSAHGTMLGLPPRDIVGKPMREVLGGAAFGALDTQVAAVLAGQPVKFERELPGPDGARCLGVSFVPDCTAQGRTRGFYVMVVDVTTQRRAEQTARDSERRLQTITDQLPAMIAFVDAQQVFRFNNLACE